MPRTSDGVPVCAGALAAQVEQRYVKLRTALAAVGQPKTRHIHLPNVKDLGYCPSSSAPREGAKVSAGRGNRCRAQASSITSEIAP